MPYLVVEDNRNRTKSLTGRACGVARKPDAFLAEHAFGVSGLRRVFRGENGFRVFFRLAEIYGNHNIAARIRDFPADVFVDVDFPYIIAVDGQVVKVFRRESGIACGKLFKRGDNLKRHRHKKPHDAGFEVDFSHSSARWFSAAYSLTSSRISCKGRQLSTGASAGASTFRRSRRLFLLRI